MFWISFKKAAFQILVEKNVSKMRETRSDFGIWRIRIPKQTLISIKQWDSICRSHVKLIFIILLVPVYIYIFFLIIYFITIFEFSYSMSGRQRWEVFYYYSMEKALLSCKPLVPRTEAEFHLKVILWHKKRDKVLHIQLNNQFKWYYC